jgi:HD-GYP domain-containing protein (c-di-GMP phosphodiesterase class II)
MKQWIAKLVSQFKINETLTREVRHEVTLRFVIWFTILVVALLAPFRFRDWVSNPTNENQFYLLNDLICLMMLFFVNILNDRHLIKLSANVYLLISVYLCFSAFPLKNPFEVLLYLAIPISIASFISDELNSIRLASFSIVFYVISFATVFPEQSFPVFAVVCLFLLGIVAYRVSALIEQMMGQLVSAYDTTIEGWSQALEMRNRETEGHSHRVADLTMRLVARMKVDETRWVHIKRGVLLHDIGKMGVPDTILCKQGPLTEEEHNVMRQHPSYARQLLSKIPYLAPTLEIPYCHHEKWDGTGYPRGLKSTEIPLEARIFSVVDVWDAMRSKRSYREPIPEPQVIEYLAAESGRSFDPCIVKAFFELLTITPPGSVEKVAIKIKKTTHEVVR